MLLQMIALGAALLMGSNDLKADESGVMVPQALSPTSAIIQNAPQDLSVAAVAAQQALSPTAISAPPVPMVIVPDSSPTIVSDTPSVVTTPVPTASPTPTLEIPPMPPVQAQPTVVAAPINPHSLAFGIGYPDLRLRGQLWGPVDGEVKVGLAGGAQAYAGRLYYNYTHLGPVGLNVGGEGGWITLNGLDGVTGEGSYGEAFLGAQVGFAKRWGVSLDVGPALMNLNSDGISQSGTEWVVSTALYLWVF